MRYELAVYEAHVDHLPESTWRDATSPRLVALLRCSPTSWDRRRRRFAKTFRWKEGLERRGESHTRYVFVHGYSYIWWVGFHPPLHSVGIDAFPIMRCHIFRVEGNQTDRPYAVHTIPADAGNWGVHACGAQHHHPGLLQEKERFVRYMATTSTKAPALHETVRSFSFVSSQQEKQK